MSVEDVGWDQLALERRPTMYVACPQNGEPAPQSRLVRPYIASHLSLLTQDTDT